MKNASRMLVASAHVAIALLGACAGSTAADLDDDAQRGALVDAVEGDGTPGPGVDCARADAAANGDDASTTATVDAGGLDAQAASTDAGAGAALDPGASDAEARSGDGAVPGDAGESRAEPRSAAAVAVVSVRGAGCPPSRTTVVIADDKESFDVRFAGFALGTSDEDTTANASCTATLRADAPPGMTLAIDAYTLRGTASLLQGASARLSTYYSHAGDAAQSAVKVTRMTGPYEGSFEMQAAFARDELLFRPCGGGVQSLHLITSLSVDAGEAGGIARASLAHLAGVRFSLRRCE